MKTVISTGVFLSLVFASCKSHDSAPSRLYHITKSIYNDQNGVATDSAKFTYDGKNISRVDVSGDKSYNATFEYTTGLITKKNIFYSSGSTSADEYIIINYSANNISLMEHYIKNGGNYVKDYVYTFSYNGNRLGRIVIAYIKNGLYRNLYQYDYTYSNNNVESVKSTDFDNNFNNETITFAYDSNKNYYNKMFAQSLVTDPMNVEINANTMPFIVSRNNVISLTIMGKAIPFTYILDSNNNLSKITTNTKQAATYEYSQN